jgi:SNF2 family DNA or RNA helicase
VKIEIENNSIVIIPPGELGVIHRSQLDFWNFRSSNNVYYADFSQSLFLKVINYLEENNLQFKLQENAQIYNNDIESITYSFTKLKQEAEAFKNGEFDKIKFSEFRDFVNTNISRSLKIHQLKAAYHLYLLGNGANFSVPGSGKTSVILTVYEKLKSEGKVNTLFVVGPPSSFGPWRNEFIETLNRELNYKVLAGGNTEQRRDQYYISSTGKAELYLTSYHSLLSDQKDLQIFLKSKRVKCFFVVDEAHYMKQLSGSWAQAILKQAKNSEYRCILTGTPMPKSYTDVFNLFDFLWPDQNPISPNEKVAIKIYEERGLHSKAKKILSKDIGPLFYRVRKSDLNLRPQIFNNPIIVDMNFYEKKIYDAIFNRIKAYSKDDYFQNIEFINKLGRSRIIRLRQAVSYAKLLASAIDEESEDILTDINDIKGIITQYDQLEIPSKIQVLLSMIDKFQKKKLKVVIWSNFIGTLHLIEKHLVERGYNCKKIYGEVPVEGRALTTEETREKIRDEFVDINSGLDILIANPAACAESISLHKTCYHAIYYDLNYNCAQYLQSLDRIHRVGGSENNEAHYYFLQYSHTIDNDIKENLDLKTKKMLDIIEEDFEIYSLDMFSDDGEDTEAYRRIFLTN